MEQTTLYSWYELLGNSVRAPLTYNLLLKWISFYYLANFGAIASLTLGASIISIVELLYYWSGKFCSGVAKNNENATIEVLTYPEDFKTGRIDKRSSGAL